MAGNGGEKAGNEGCYHPGGDVEHNLDARKEGQHIDAA
jgi:hypothetical protein